MKLKRVFTPGQKEVADCMSEGADGRAFNHLDFRAAGGDIKVEIQHLSKEWHISPRVLENGVSEGWMSVGGGKAILNTPEGPVEYLIASPPKKNVDGSDAKNRNFYDLRLVENG